MADRRTEAVVRVQRIADLATDDAEKLANRMYYASREVAIGRFAKIWPQARSRNSPTRGALQRWYVGVFERELAEPIAGYTAASLDGVEAGRVLQGIRDRLHTPDATTLRVITALARDSQAVAADLAVARAQLVQSGLAGRISTALPRIPDTPVSTGQAIAEQWYARAFHATIDPKLFAQQTPPISPGEVDLVSAAVSTRQPRILWKGGDLIQPPNGTRTAREQAAWDWQGQPVQARAEWLQREGFGQGHVLTPFDQLPMYLQSRLLRATAEETTVRPAITDYDIPTGSATEQAAQMFDAAPITVATEQDLNTHRLLFTRRGVTIPSEGLRRMPDLGPVSEALNELARQNLGDRFQMRGYAQLRRLNDDQLAAAVRMHRDGALYKDIARDLGVHPDTLRNRLKTYEATKPTGPTRGAAESTPQKRPKERDSDRLLRKRQEQGASAATGGAMTDAAQQAKTVSEHGTAGRTTNAPAAEGSAPAKRPDANAGQQHDGPQHRRGR